MELTVYWRKYKRAPEPFCICNFQKTGGVDPRRLIIPPEIRTPRWQPSWRCQRCPYPVMVSVLPATVAALKVSVTVVRLAFNTALLITGTDAATPGQRVVCQSCSRSLIHRLDKGYRIRCRKTARDGCSWHHGVLSRHGGTVGRTHVIRAHRPHDIGVGQLLFWLETKGKVGVLGTASEKLEVKADGCPAVGWISCNCPWHRQNSAHDKHCKLSRERLAASPAELWVVVVKACAVCH